jgi:hypothetical protein
VIFMSIGARCVCCEGRCFKRTQAFFTRPELAAMAVHELGELARDLARLGFTQAMCPPFVAWPAFGEPFEVLA